jgi:exopolyphosphatase / guanosine-5'-triphosphate,3'-diphosphate pyrophosphatase
LRGVPFPPAAPDEGGALAPEPAPARRLGAPGEVLAALDLGTNNCRLLVARTTHGGFRVIDSFSRITRLGEGLGAGTSLGEAAMARTIEALAACAAKIAHRGVGRGRYVATDACRRAGNCAAFLARAEAATGLRLEIIGSGEEARLVVAGCAALLDPAVPRAVVFDIGGGSTEVSYVRVERRAAQVLDAVSLPFGVVNLTERYGGDRVPPDAYRAMLDEVAAALAPFEARHRIAAEVARGRVQMLGSSGTVTTLAGIEFGLPRYIRSVVDGSSLGFAAIEAVSQRLAALSLAERAAHPCVGRERADLVVAGCAILEAICRMWPVGRLRVADRGVREGILIGLSGRVRR